MYVTVEQERILDLIKEYRCLSKEQIICMYKIKYGHNAQLSKLIKQLCHIYPYLLHEISQNTLAMKSSQADADLSIAIEIIMTFKDLVIDFKKGQEPWKLLFAKPNSSGVIHTYLITAMKKDKGKDYLSDCFISLNPKQIPIIVIENKAQLIDYGFLVPYYYAYKADNSLEFYPRNI